MRATNPNQAVIAVALERATLLLVIVLPIAFLLVPGCASGDGSDNWFASSVPPVSNDRGDAASGDSGDNDTGFARTDTGDGDTDGGDGDTDGDDNGHDGDQSSTGDGDGGDGTDTDTGDGGDGDGDADTGDGDTGTGDGDGDGGDTVIVPPPDEVPPLLRLLSPIGGEAFTLSSGIIIRWDCRDDGGMPDACIRLFVTDEFRGEDTLWRQLLVPGADAAAVPSGEHRGLPALPNRGRFEWSPLRLPASTDYRVRIEAVDLAGNVARVVSAASFTVLPEASSDPDERTPPRIRFATPPDRHARSTTLTLEYTIAAGTDATGPDAAEPAIIEVAVWFRWLPLSGSGAPSAWRRFVTTAPSMPSEGTIDVDVSTFGEGEYEFDLSCRDERGLSSEGDGPTPRASVRVDTTPPTVILLSHGAGEPVIARVASDILWECEDTDVAGGGVRLFLQPGGRGDGDPEWQPIEGAAALSNTGRFRWVPTETQIAPRCLLRIEVTDVAGWVTIIDTETTFTIVRPMPRPGFSPGTATTIRAARTELDVVVTQLGRPYALPIESITLWRRRVGLDGSVGTWQADAFTADEPVVLDVSNDLAGAGDGPLVYDLYLTVTDTLGYSNPRPQVDTFPLLTVSVTIADDDEDGRPATLEWAR